MDSSPVLRQQTQSKIHSDFLRTRNEQNKVPALSKSPRVLSERPHFKQDVENKDPGSSVCGRKLPMRAGVSRLPVLSKSLRLQTPSDFSQSHCRWEEKPLAGKAKNKRPCTRQLPFNLSQPKNSRTASENRQPQTASQSRTVHADRKVHTARLKTQTSAAKPPQPPCSWRSTRSAAGVAQPSGQSGLSNKFKTSASSSRPTSSVSLSTRHQSHAPSSARAASSAQACLDNMNLLSLKDPARTSHAAHSTQSGASERPADEAEVFKPDHAALLSILRNEPIAASATPQSRLYNPLPQRVSVMKSQQRAGATNGSVTLARSSLEPSARQSVLRSGGLPSGPQRVPVKKSRAAQPGGAVAASLRETPQRDWTPQRVPNTRHQPISAMKWHQTSPFGGTPGLWQSRGKLRPRQEVNTPSSRSLSLSERHQRSTSKPGSEAQEIVQRLFEDEDNEPRVTDPEAGAEQLPLKAASVRCEPCLSLEEKKEQSVVARQPFIQAPERESVIFFSTGKSRLRVACFEQAEGPAQQSQPDSLCPHKSVPKPPAQNLHRDPALQRSCALALLQKRRPALAELRLDEEVSTYTTASTPAVLAPRPRCENPLASVLLFEESTRFAPISCDPPSARSSPLSFSLQGR